MLPSPLTNSPPSPATQNKGLVNICHSTSQTQIWSPNLGSKWPVYVVSVSQAVGSGVSRPPCWCPFARWRLCFREPLKQFFCSLSRQLPLLTSLCSYLDTCCQLLSAHNQPRRIMLQWAASLHVVNLSPKPAIHTGSRFSHEVPLTALHQQVYGERGHR